MAAVDRGADRCDPLQRLDRTERPVLVVLVLIVVRHKKPPVAAAILSACTPRPSARFVRRRAHHGAVAAGVLLNLRVDPDDLDRLTHEAEARGVTRSELVRSALATALPDVPWRFAQDTSDQGSSNPHPPGGP